MPRPRPIDGTPVTQRQQFGRELRQLREAAGLAVQQLATAVARNRTTISKAEAGLDIPSEHVVIALDEVLHASGLLLSRYEGIVIEKRLRRLERQAPQTGAAPSASDDDAAMFVSETIPDGTLMAAGEHFTKTWTIRNAGTVPWHRRRLTRIGLHAAPGLIATPQSVHIPDTAPGEAVTLTVPCIAQYVEGTSAGSFKMTDDHGRRYFADRYYDGLRVQVTVMLGRHPRPDQPTQGTTATTSPRLLGDPG